MMPAGIQDQDPPPPSPSEVWLSIFVVLLVLCVLTPYACNQPGQFLEPPVFTDGKPPREVQPMTDDR
jgi:hypothetical protein